MFLNELIAFSYFAINFGLQMGPCLSAQGTHPSTGCQLPSSKQVKTAQSSTKSSCTQEQITIASTKLAELFEEYWTWKLNEYPESATWRGIHTMDDRFTNITIDANNERYKSVLKFLEKAQALKACIQHHEDVDNLQYFEDELTTFKEGHTYNGYYFPLDYIRGFHTSLSHLLRRMPLDSLQGYENMINRLDKVPGKINDIIGVLKAGVAIGITHHYHSMKGINGSISSIISEEPSSSVFYKFFTKDFPTSLTAAEISQLQKRALDIIRDKVFPAFDKLRKYIVDEYKTRKDIGITSLPNGPAIYQRLIRLHASGDYTAQEIFDIGQCEVKGIRLEMEKIAGELGHPGSSVKELAKILKDDPKNYYATKEELLKGYETLIKEIDLKLPEVFKRIPSIKVIVEEDPSPTTTLAYYRSPSIDGKKPGTFVVGTHNTKNNPIYNMMTLTLHEALPGHHQQIAHENEFANFPKFRKFSIGSVYQASGFTTQTAYAEGWALYAEYLGLQMKLFENPKDRFGHYNFEMWRACRLVVDAGMHALGWTRLQAIDFMDENLAIDRSAIEREIDRYISWPGQALAYKAGELKIQELKKRAEDKLKNKFDIKDFHDVVLNVGTVPMSFVDKEIEAYIENTLNP